MPKASLQLAEGEPTGVDFIEFRKLNDREGEFRIVLDGEAEVTAVGTRCELQAVQEYQDKASQG